MFGNPMHKQSSNLRDSSIGHMESNFYIIDPVKRRSPEDVIQLKQNETKLSRGLKLQSMNETVHQQDLNPPKVDPKRDTAKNQANKVAFKSIAVKEHQFIGTDDTSRPASLNKDSVRKSPSSELKSP